MEYILSALIIGLCLYLVLQPFFNKKSSWKTEAFKNDLDSISLEQIYATLNEAEMEYHMGKLPKEEYDTLTKQYEKLAAEKLKEETSNHVY